MTNSRRPFLARRTRSSDLQPKAHFRGDIQGLRAVAVGAVILDHGKIPGFGGGFTGVDVFFVISGFLITNLLLNDVAKFAKIRFSTFYARRAARILPAATLVIVVTAIAAVAILGVLQARSVMDDSLWAVFFAANIHFSSVGTNYFAASHATSPLLHYWSLAVEEQFYLVWPALLGLVVLFSRKKGHGHVPRVQIATVLGLIFAGSLYLSVVQTNNNKTAAYFSTFDRAWELALGALLAVSLPFITKIPSALRASLSWAGIAGIITATLLFSASTAIPGWRDLLPVLASGAVLLGGVGTPDGGAHLLLSLRPFRFIGDISYSLYLWHFPVLILGKAYFGASDTLWVRLALIAGTFALATLSYYRFENPLRHARVLLHRAWHGLLLWPVATGLVLIVVLIVTPTVPFAASVGPAAKVPVAVAVAQAVTAAENRAPVPPLTSPSLLSAPSDSENIGDCSGFNKLRNKICEFGDPSGTKTIVVFGNSHTTMWVPAIARAAKAEHWKFFPVVKESCGYDFYTALARGVSPNSQCPQWYAWAKNVIAHLHPNVIVIGSYTKTSDWFQGEKTTIAQLKPLTKRLVLLSDTPWIPSPAGCLLRSGVTQKNCLWHESPKRVRAQRLTREVALQEQVNYVDVTPWFCDDKLCPSLINGIVPYKDGAHVTPQYSRYLGNAMQKALNLKGTKVIQPTLVPLPATATTTTSTTTTPT
ncbi:MAG TPA: acyltransferase family protein [Acidimicrobiales bacterium]|nr:acyltransferase family protein [Acidimicrobiales bacterium]